MPEILRGAVAIPSYRFPEAAARALGHAAQRAAWLRRRVGQHPGFSDIDPEAARRIVNAALQRESPVWLRADQTHACLTAYGIAMPAEIVAHSATEAANAFRQLGGPVVMKLVSDSIVHKSDVGGVRLAISTPESATDAYQAIGKALDVRGLTGAMSGAVVQPMITGGVECLVGVVSDPTLARSSPSDWVGCKPRSLATSGCDCIL